MWLATKVGFFSVVCGRDSDGKVDGTVLVIRARRREHLENLIVHLVPGVTPDKVLVSQLAGTDYPFRIVLPRRYGAKLIDVLVQNIDYDNFKDAAAAEHPDDLEYRRFLHATWAEGCRMENGRKSLEELL